MTPPTVSLKAYMANPVRALRDAGIGPPGQEPGVLTAKMVKGLPVARGRTSKPVPGKMNGMEKRYAQHLEHRKRIGEVAAYFFEAVKFKLANNTHYAPDFMVMLADGTIELHETKGGHIEDDAAVKMKVQSEAFWMFRLVLVREKPTNVWHLRSLDR